MENHFCEVRSLIRSCRNIYSEGSVDLWPAGPRDDLDGVRITLAGPPLRAEDLPLIVLDLKPEH